MHKEKLSSLIDGESLDKEVITQLAADKAMQQDWHRYHLIRETLRGNIHNQTIDLDLADRIALALDNEPTKLAPVKEMPNQPEPEVWSKFPFWQKIRPLVSQLSQIGVAACVTLVVIAGVQQYNKSDNVSDTPAFTTVPMVGHVSPVAYNVSSVQHKNNSEAEKKQLERIRMMLQDYELQRRLYAEK